MFTVVIPLYNKEKYILETVESVLAQDFKDFELIIVNDGSTDGSLSKIQNISDPRISIINKENTGVSQTRNTGLSSAKFDWIAFLDGDDLWAPNHLSELKLIIEKFPTSGLVSTKYKTFYDKIDNSNQNEYSDIDIRLIDYFLEPVIWTSATAVKKNVFNKIGGFADYKNGEDLEYWVRIALYYPIAISNRITAYYRLDTGGISDSYARDKNYLKEINSLREISPSFELLIEKAKDEPSILKKDNIKFYINKKLLGGTKTWLLKENIYMAKQLTKFGIPQLSQAFIILAFIEVMPKSGLKKMIEGYNKIRNCEDILKLKRSIKKF